MEEKGQENPLQLSINLLALKKYLRDFAFGRRKIPDSSSEDEVLGSYLHPKDSDLRLYGPLGNESDSQSGNSRVLDMEFRTKFSEGMTLFAVEDGYFGVGPPRTMKGDRICILQGCPLPLLKRPQGKQIVLIGSCYVYGVMCGEIMKDVETGKRHVEPMELV